MEIWRDIHGAVLENQPVYAARAVCFTCGKPANAVWHGDPELYVCMDCAIEHLPRLIADAIAGRYGERFRIDSITKNMDGIIKQIWLAVAHALHDRIDKKSH